MKYQLAQFNIGTIKDTMDSALMHGFASRLDEINALAEAHEGFVWRLQDESGNATGILEYEDPFQLVNMSVWESVETLKQYTYQSMHRELLRDRKQWFHAMQEMHYVLWWVPTGHRPTVAEAKERLALLQRLGSTAEAFDFKKPFPPPH
ncbi:MAG: DUF3291 domain-containing protein [Bacteroidota bacterium]